MLVTPMQGKKVRERRSVLHPSGKDLLERRSVTTVPYI
jgi:hypothetical protein